jgi:cytochrome P450
MDPENIHACLVSQSHEFEIGPARHKAIIPLLGHSVLTSDGAIWSHHRGVMRKNFVKTELEDLDIFEKHFENFVASVPKDGSTFEARDLLSKLTMDISTDFLLGCSTNSLKLHANQLKDEFLEAWNIAMGWIPLRCHLGALMNWIPHRSFFEACNTIHTYADQLVAQSLASTPGEKHEIQSSRYIFLHEMAKDIKDPVQLRDHAISILTAGRDTTAETLSGIINMLLKHPDVLALLRQEIAQLNGERPTSAAIKEMSYLRNVINEGSHIPLSHQSKFPIN